MVAQAVIAARTQMTKHTLSVAAQGLVPEILSALPKPALVKNTLPVSPTPQIPIAYSLARNTQAPSSPLPERTVSSRKRARQCRPKLVHFDFLSALFHARTHFTNLGEDNLNIYPCLICNGIHIGHRKTRKTKTVKN